VFGYGYLRGIRDALLHAAREGGWEGERLLANLLTDIRIREGDET